MKVCFDHLKPLLELPFIITLMDEEAKPVVADLIHRSGKRLSDLLCTKFAESVQRSETFIGSMQGQISAGRFHINFCHVVEIPIKPQIEQSVIVLHVDDNDPGHIFVTPVDQLPLARTLCEQIIAYTFISPDMPFGPSCGNVCLAKSASDDQWYRGVCVEEIDATNSIIFFADFGFQVSIFVLLV
jgi:hypothetical protein